MTEAQYANCGHTYQRLPHARSGLCCSCRGVKRRKDAVAPHDLAPGAFDSQAALDAWYAEDALRCHICGGAYPGLYQHVGRTHGVSAREYKLRYGIPITYGLSGRATRMAQRRNGASTAGKMREAGYANLAAARSRKGHTRTKWAPYQARDHVVKMTEASGHPSNYTGNTWLTCTICGGSFQMPASIALSFQCRARCAACQDKRSAA